MKPSCGKVLWIFILIFITAGCTSPLTTPYIAVDGFADGEVFVWFDENANGMVDSGEKPLSRVLVGIGYPNTFTEENGKASVGEFMAGCANDCWKGEKVYVDVPQGYKPTTPTEYPLTGYEQTYQFGFALDPTSATATPYLSHLACKTYKGIATEDSVVAFDGSLWVVLFDGVARYDLQSDQFHFYESTHGLYENISVGENGEIWIASQESTISRFLDSEWITYGKDSLITASDIALVSYSGDEVWFARQSSPNSIISFNKKSGEWKYFTPSNNVKRVVGQNVRLSTDGSTWFAAFGYRAEKAVPVSDIKINWKVYDLHTFTEEEIIEMPNLMWIEDSQIAMDGTIWLITSQGLTQFNPLTNTWKIYNWPHTEFIDRGSIAISPDGSIWVGISSNGKPLTLRYIPDSNDTNWYTYDDRDGIPEIDNIAITPDGRIWFGSGLASSAVVGCNLLK